MANILSKPRRARVGREGGAASVREVCLLGVAMPGWSEGDRVEWEGRAYRVTARIGAGSDSGCYVHLATEADGIEAL
jgi:hypothetical protein